MIARRVAPAAIALAAALGAGGCELVLGTAGLTEGAPDGGPARRDATAGVDGADTASVDAADATTADAPGDAAPCEAGAACTPTDPCHVGAVVCGPGGPSCEDTSQKAPDGTPCGAGKVCLDATCVKCPAAAACTPSEPCQTGAIDCSSGAPVCVPTRPADPGQLCDAGTCCGGSCVDLEPDSGQCATCCTGGPRPLCGGGLCAYELADAGYAGQLALDPDHVYWTDTRLGTVTRARLDGSDPQTLASGLEHPGGLALGSTEVYWTSDQRDGGVSAASLDGGGVRVIATRQNLPKCVLVAPPLLWWADDDDALVSVPLGGGAPSSIATAMAPLCMAVGPSSLYSSQGGSVVRSDLDGGDPISLFTGALPDALLLWNQTIFWVDGVAQTLMSVGVDGGAVRTLASGQEQATGLAVDATGVYFSTSINDGIVGRVGLDGGAVTTLAARQYLPGAVAIDGTSVYWVVTGSAVMKAAK